MLLWILLTILLPMTTTEESTLPPPSDQKTTLQPKQDTPETATDAFNQNKTTKIIPTTAEALKVVTPMEKVTPALVTQKQFLANSEATTLNTMNETSSTQTKTPTHLVKSNETSTTQDFATSTIQNAESSTPVINSSQRVILSTVPSTSSGNISSIQTSTTATETVKVVVQPGRATTRAVPTAKLSATTEMVSKTTTSLQNATDFVQTISSAKTTSLAPVKSSPSPVIPNVQKSTTKVFTTTRGKTTVAKNIDETKEETKKGVKHGKIVAGLIGGALLAMMIGFLVILYKKHKMKKQQIATTDWAGPTPFLETDGGGDNGHVTLRSASRISLTSFLPQRLSKRLSLLAENAEEMQDMTVGTTFAVKEGEKNGVKSEQKSETSAKEAEENNSECSAKTDELVLVDEMKDNDEEVRKDKINGQAVMDDEEKGLVDSNATEPAAKESENGNTEGEKINADDDV